MYSGAVATSATAKAGSCGVEGARGDACMNSSCGDSGKGGGGGDRIRAVRNVLGGTFTQRGRNLLETGDLGAGGAPVASACSLHGDIGSIRSMRSKVGEF